MQLLREGSWHPTITYRCRKTSTGRYTSTNAILLPLQSHECQKMVNIKQLICWNFNAMERDSRWDNYNNVYIRIAPTFVVCIAISSKHIHDNASRKP